VGIQNYTPIFQKTRILQPSLIEVMQRKVLVLDLHYQGKSNGYILYSFVCLLYNHILYFFHLFFQKLWFQNLKYKSLLGRILV
jgi:hypothetical protein